MTAPKKKYVPTWLLPVGTKRKSFKATKQIRLPIAKPDCFDTSRQWGIYRVLAQISAHDGFTFCTDCTPERRDLMIAAGRCKFPGTTFIVSNGVVVGRRGK